jgi:hypothetical protein
MILRRYCELQVCSGWPDSNRRPVTLLTFDTSQAARARNAGLAVNKLTKPLGEEPEDIRGKRTRQPVARTQT